MTQTHHRSTSTEGPTRVPPAYHAVLRHEDHLGDERTTSAAPHLGRTSLSRVVAGFAAAGITTPLSVLLLDSSVLPIAALTLLAGFLGAQISHENTRRELRRWSSHLALTTERLFRSGPATPPSRVRDYEDVLEDLAGTLEATLESELQHERDAIIATITSLASALEARDPHTRNHSAQVGKLAARVGREMGLPRSELYELHLAGLLHDLGKIGIPDAILLKPAGLTRAEYEVMKTHPVLGARILSGLPGLENVTRIVLHHHEMVDGRGYPDGLSGDAIPLGARIIAVCDTYLSMVENRPYRQGQSMARIHRELRRVAGHQLDADVVDGLLSMLAREAAIFGQELEDEPEQKIA